MKILNIIILLVFLIISSLVIEYYKISNEGFETNTNIPKKIWTYWDNDNLPDIIVKCIDTWKKQNPNYEIIVLSKQNLSKYLPDVDFSKIKHIDSATRFSDMVRLHVLAKYGGIWSDASIICLKPYDSWIPNMQSKSNAEFVGFYIDGFTLPQFKEKSPVIESWFLACVKDSRIVNDWLNEFLRISDFDTVEKYVESVKDEGVDLQKINSPVYLSIHVACQKILQNGLNKPYSFELLKAEDTAYKYLIQNDWNSQNAVKNIINCAKSKANKKNCSFLDSPIIKLRSNERNEIEKIDYSFVFK
jgi:hypothetical protein